MVIVPGTRLADAYVVERVLGSGGWGTVYAAVQEKSGRRVALKVLKNDPGTSPGDLARFEREARAAASIGHPNIVQVTDFRGPGDEPAFLVMELLEGQTFGAALRDGPMAPPRVAFIVTQILSALEAAHAVGIVHRDIKPENVFLVSLATGSELVKVLDFGLASLAGAARLTATDQIVGTPTYMAPEQAIGRAIDARCDLYSVGATMYRALAGRPAFATRNVVALLAAVVSEAPPPLETIQPDVPAWLVAIVARAMQKDPSLRFASATEMRRAIEAAGRSRTRRPRRRRRVPIIAFAAGAVLVLLVALAAAFGYVARRAAMQPPTAPITVVAPSVPAPSEERSATLPQPPPESSPPVPRALTLPRYGPAHPVLRGVGATNIKAAVAREQMPGITRCFAATVRDPPLHDVVSYAAHYDENGVMTSFTRTDDVRHRKLDTCVEAVMRKTKNDEPNGHDAELVLRLTP